MIVLSLGPSLGQHSWTDSNAAIKWVNSSPASLFLIGENTECYWHDHARIWNKIITSWLSTIWVADHRLANACHADHEHSWQRLLETAYEQSHNSGCFKSERVTRNYGGVWPQWHATWMTSLTSWTQKLQWVPPKRCLLVNIVELLKIPSAESVQVDYRAQMNTTDN